MHEEPQTQSEEPTPDESYAEQQERISREGAGPVQPNENPEVEIGDE